MNVSFISQVMHSTGDSPEYVSDLGHVVAHSFIALHLTLTFWEVCFCTPTLSLVRSPTLGGRRGWEVSDVNLSHQRQKTFETASLTVLENQHLRRIFCNMKVGVELISPLLCFEAKKQTWRRGEFQSLHFSLQFSDSIKLITGKQPDFGCVVFERRR